VRAALAGRFARLTTSVVLSSPPCQLRNRRPGIRHERESTQSRLVHSSTARKGHRRAAVTPGSNIRRSERPSAERRFCGLALPLGAAPATIPPTLRADASGTKPFSPRSRTQVVTRTVGTTLEPNRRLPACAGRGQSNMEMLVSMLAVSVFPAPHTIARIVCNA